jgi:DNA polymerase-3 subunit epsilon
MRIWAEQSPFELKDELKKRGYRWSDGADGRPGSWYIDVDEANEATEIEFLTTIIYLRDVEPRIQAMNAINRFSNCASSWRRTGPTDLGVIRSHSALTQPL